MTRARTETIVAIVNGLVIWWGPVLLVWSRSADSNTTAVVYPPGVSGAMLLLRGAAWMELTLLPFAAIAAWRSWVYGRRVLSGRSHGWGGVFEASALGAGFLVAMNIRILANSPALSGLQLLLSYILWAGVVGMMIGFILFLTGHAVLWLFRPRTGQTRLNLQTP